MSCSGDGAESDASPHERGLGGGEGSACGSVAAHCGSGAAGVPTVSGEDAEEGESVAAGGVLVVEGGELWVVDAESFGFWLNLKSAGASVRTSSRVGSDDCGMEKRDSWTESSTQALSTVFISHVESEKLLPFSFR
jgi:hypothetical protein